MCSRREQSPAFAQIGRSRRGFKNRGVRRIDEDTRWATCRTEPAIRALTTEFTLINDMIRVSQQRRHRAIDFPCSDASPRRKADAILIPDKLHATAFCPSHHLACERRRRAAHEVKHVEMFRLRPAFAEMEQLHFSSSHQLAPRHHIAIAKHRLPRWHTKGARHERAPEAQALGNREQFAYGESDHV